MNSASASTVLPMIDIAIVTVIAGAAIPWLFPWAMGLDKYLEETRKK